MPHSEISGSVCKRLPGAYRSVTTSFIGPVCQGIHHLLLFTCANLSIFRLPPSHHLLSQCSEPGSPQIWSTSMFCSVYIWSQNSHTVGDRFHFLCLLFIGHVRNCFPFLFSLVAILLVKCYFLSEVCQFVGLPVFDLVQGEERKSNSLLLLALFCNVLRTSFATGNKRGLGIRASSLVAVGMRIGLFGYGPSCLHFLSFFRHGRFYRHTRVIIQGSAGFVKAISRLFLTNFAAFTKLPVDLRRLELLTPAMQMRCSPN